MFGKKRGDRVSVVSDTPPEGGLVPPDPMKTWRIEQTDGFRTIEANYYNKGARYVSFYAWVPGEWQKGPWGWSIGHESRLVCELNHDYILSIEESI